MSVYRFHLIWCAALLAIVSMSSVKADVVLGGSATVQFDTTALLNTTGLTPVWFYNSTNGAQTATQTEILAPFGGGGSALPPAATHSLNHAIIIGSVVNPTGRARQPTNADFDPISPLASWSAGEQIGLDGITAFTVASGGGLVTGDFSVVYDSVLNRLSLVNNFQFPVEAFRVNNPTVTTNPLGFTVQGELSTGFFFTGFGIPTDQRLGSFSMNTITAVPEPTSLALLACGITGFGFRRLRKARTGLATANKD